MAPKYEADLAERYMALNDKSYLNSLVENVLQRQREDEAKMTAEEKAQIARALQRAEEFEPFKASAEYRKQMADLRWANVFETGTGVAFVLRDYRCVDVENSGEVSVYADLPERDKRRRKDRKWKFSDDERKQAHIARFGETVIRELFMQDVAPRP